MPFPPPGDLSNPEIKFRSSAAPALQAGSFTTELQDTEEIKSKILAVSTQTVSADSTCNQIRWSREAAPGARVFSEPLSIDTQSKVAPCG